MPSTSKTAATKSILTPSMTLKGHRRYIESISYFPDAQRLISGSHDKTARQWDLTAGKEIEEARDVCERHVWVVAVSKDGRWVITGGGELHSVELKVYEVETGTVKNLEGHSDIVCSIDISEDNTLLASGSFDETVRIWNLETGKLVAGPFESIQWVGAVRFSTDSKKLAVISFWGMCLEVWDVQLQKLDKRIGNGFENHGRSIPSAPIFWTNNNKNLLAAFSFTKDDDQYDANEAMTIHEFDASTLETVGIPFEGHTRFVTGLALSFDGALLASASYDGTIKLWAFESRRQLLASFKVQNLRALILSPDSRKLAYTTYTKDTNDYKICICDTPPDILALAQARVRNPANIHFP
jgi:WD40 repeat protein